MIISPGEDREVKKSYQQVSNGRESSWNVLTKFELSCNQACFEMAHYYFLSFCKKKNEEEEEAQGKYQAVIDGSWTNRGTWRWPFVVLSNNWLLPFCCFLDFRGVHWCGQNKLEEAYDGVIKAPKLSYLILMMMLSIQSCQIFGDSMDHLFLHLLILDGLFQLFYAVVEVGFDGGCLWPLCLLVALFPFTVLLLFLPLLLLEMR